MKKTLFILCLLMIAACKQSKFSKELGCENVSVDNLEVVEDVYKRFSVTIPKTWKTNLYYDTNQSSIFTADTTKQLTETYIIDVTRMSMPISFNEDFLNRYKKNITENKLVVNSSYETTFLEKEAFYSRVIGKKRGFPFEQISIYVKLNGREHLYVKAEVYGDSLVNERLCKAMYLLEKITAK